MPCIAWRYFQNNTDPVTGLVNFTDNYLRQPPWNNLLWVTMSAQRLAVIERDEAVARSAFAGYLTLRLFDGKGQTRPTTYVPGELVNYANEPVERGLGWSVWTSPVWSAPPLAMLRRTNTLNYQNRSNADGTLAPCLMSRTVS
jgi:hypothetical protein